MSWDIHSQSFAKCIYHDGVPYALLHTLYSHNTHASVRGCYESTLMQYSQWQQCIMWVGGEYTVPIATYSIYRSTPPPCPRYVLLPTVYEGCVCVSIRTGA